MNEFRNASEGKIYPILKQTADTIYVLTQVGLILGAVSDIHRRGGWKAKRIG